MVKIRKNKNAKPFTSMKLIGTRAQTLWAKAKTRMKTDGDELTGPLPKFEKQNEVTVNLSAPSVAKATLTIITVLVGAWLLFIVRDKLIILMLAVFVSVVVDPAVRFLEGWGVPRGLTVVLVYLVFLSLAIFLLASLIPIIAVQLQSLAVLINSRADSFLSDPRISIPFLPAEYNAGLTTFMQETLRNLDIQDKASFIAQYGIELQTQMRGFLTLAVGFTSQVATFIINLAVVLVLAFFMQLEKEKIFEYFRILFPYNIRNYLDHKSEVIHRKISQWITGQITLCLAIATFVFIALNILGMQEYALTLALLAGFTEFIPVAGPIIAAVPAVIIAFTQEGLVWGLAVAAVYYAIQWCENNLLVPLIMKRAVGLSPIAVLFAMLIGLSFPDTIHPILGVILSVPITTVLAIFIHDFREYRRREH